MKKLMNRIGGLWPAILLMPVFFLGLPQHVQAQVPEAKDMYAANWSPPRVEWGIKGGVRTMNFHGEDATDAGSEAGFSVGAFLSYRLGRHLALQPEVLFSHRQARVDHSRYLDTRQAVQYTIENIDVPLLLKAFLPPHVGTFSHLYAGPVVGFMLNTEAREVLGTRKFDVEDRFRPVTLGLAFGLGGESIGRQRILFDVRYTVGLTDMMRSGDNPRFTEQGFTVGIGIGF